MELEHQQLLFRLRRANDDDVRQQFDDLIEIVDVHQGVMYAVVPGGRVVQNQGETPRKFWERTVVAYHGWVAPDEPDVVEDDEYEPTTDAFVGFSGVPGAGVTVDEE